MKRWTGRIAAVIVLACVPHAAAWAQAALPPAAAFFEPAQIRDVQISPSGRWLMMLTSLADGRAAMRVIDLEGKEGAKLFEPPTHYEIAAFDWVDDDWIVCRMQDRDNRITSRVVNGLLAVKRDGSDYQVVIEGRSPDVKRHLGLPRDHYYLGRTGNAGEILVAQLKFDTRGELDDLIVKAVEVGTMRVRTLDPDAPHANAGAWVDQRGRLRLLQRIEGDTVKLMWSDAPGKWREIASQPRLTPRFAPVYAEDDQLFVAVEDDKGLTVRKLDLTTGQPDNVAVLSTPGFNGAPMGVMDWETRRIQGVRALLESWATVWFSPSMTRLQAAVDAKLPGLINVIRCPRGCDAPRAVLIHSYSATEPGMWVVYRPQQDQWQLLGRSRPAIEPARMATVSFTEFAARDGLRIPLWVTRPPLASPARPLPTVVLVHAGPWSRGAYWEWNAEAQFLASRGYLVLQPEFRGSAGYSSRLERAGWKQWGLAMQDDLTDALRYAAAQGWADEKRACIMGTSYGGYAALMGLAKDPDLYRCGIAYAAVSDTRHLFEFGWDEVSSDTKQYSLPQLVGDPKTDDAQFAATSPVVQAGRIKAPVLLVHGASDRRVPIANAERMREALARNGRAFEWKVYDNEGHGFLHPENAIDFYQRVEVFLAKHLK